MGDEVRNCVLLTGATGTVGSAVLDLLADNGRFEVHSIVRHEMPQRQNVVWQVLDLHSEAFPRSLAGVEYDYIIDCAQPRYEGEGCLNFGVEHIRKLESLCTARTRRLIYTSGVWVYGHQRNGKPIAEGTSMNPVEQAMPRMPVLDYLNKVSSLPWIQLCLPSFVYGAIGPLQEVAKMVASGTARVLDDPCILWSMVERSDLARAYLAVLVAKDIEGVCLVAESEPVSILGFYQSVADTIGAPFRANSLESLRRECTPESLEIICASQPVDSRRLRELTGWENLYCFEKDVAQFLPVEERRS